MSRAPKAVVSVVAARPRLVDAVDEALTAAGLEACVSPGARVLVKPNLHGGDGHTSEALMTAACRWAFEHGAREVLLGDGAYWGIGDATAYFEACGVYRACEATGALPVDLHGYPYKLHRPGVGGVPAVIGVSRHLYECDTVINLPLMKTHFNTLVTIALKNIKGCLRRVDKRKLHECDLNYALGVVNTLVQPLVSATLCDATTAYEGIGPGHGTPVPMGLLVASRDPVALDTICCELMGIDPATVRLIGESAGRGVGEGNREAIAVVGEDLRDHARPFKLPHQALAEAFPALTVRSSRACSCCMQNLFLALQQARDQHRALCCDSLLIGPGEPGEGELLVGNCAAQGQGRPADVPGCPPSPQAIYGRIVADM